MKILANKGKHMKKLTPLLEDEFLNPRSDPVARCLQKQFPIRWCRLLAFGLIALLSHYAARATMIEQPCYQVTSVPELGQQVQLDFNVINDNDFSVILDYALVTVYNTAGDPSDYANYPSFVTWFPIIAADSTQSFVISFTVSTPSPGDTDMDTGINSVTFATEWSPLVGTPLLAFATPQFGLVVIDNDNNLIPTANYAAGVAGLLNGIVPTSPIDVGGQSAETWARINVYDTPDGVSTLALLDISTLSLLACDWRRRTAKA